MPTLKHLKTTLEQSQTPTETVAAALALLEASTKRQYVDAALIALERESSTAIMSDSHRDILRKKCLHYFNAPPTNDKAGTIREKLTRLLAHIGNPADEDIYRMGVETYYPQPVTDTAQNLRAVALAALAMHNQRLACLYATKLLGEVDTSEFNGEPSITAIQVLKRYDRPLPIYQFILLRGQNFFGEPVAQAFEALGPDFPENLFRQAAAPFVEAGASVPCTGIINAAIARTDCNDLLTQIITETDDLDLHHYGVIMMATSRRDDLLAELFRLARLAKPDEIGNYLEAIELSTHDDRDEMLTLLRKRQQ